MGWDGFDSVELVMDLEDAFGLSISDADAERLHTAGELHAYLVVRIGAAADGPASRCASAAAFYRTRRILSESLGIKRARLRPGLAVDQLLPAEHRGRREIWQRLGRTLGVRLPPLCHSKPFARAAVFAGFFVLATSLACFAVALATTSPYRHTAAPVARVALGLAVVGLLTPTAILTAARSKASRVPDGYESVGQLSGVLVGSEIERLMDKADAWTEHGVWEAVRWFTAQSADVAPATIRRDTRFSALR